MLQTRLNPRKSRLQQLIMLAAAFTLLVIGLFSATNFLAYRYLTGTLPNLLRVGDLQVPMLVLDEALTMSARLSTATGDPEWEARYRRLEPQLDQAFRETLHLSLEPAFIQAVIQSDAANKKRVVMENRAFELVRQGQQVQAYELLSSEAYQAQKEVYAAGLAEVGRLLKQDIDTVRERRRVRLLWSLAVAAILTPLLILGWWLVLRALRRWQATVVERNRQIFQKTADLSELNSRLDQKVNERTKELSDSMLASLNIMEDAVRHQQNTAQAYANLKKQDAELAARAIELARSNEELERFAHVAAHDLQEPLRTIQSFTQLMVREFGDRGNAKTDEYAAYISDGVHRMKEMIEGVMVYSRLAHQQQVVETIDLALAYQNSIATLDSAIRESSAIVTCGPLPKMRVDANLFHSLFQNLIGNALKFRGAAVPKIDIECRRIGEEWVFSVQDNGIGIPAAHGERIFGMFQRVHSRDQFPGSGLGLAMCKRIVEQQGGRIWSEPVPHGSRLVFTLPVEKGAADLLPAA